MCGQLGRKPLDLRETGEKTHAVRKTLVVAVLVTRGMLQEKEKDVVVETTNDGGREIMIGSRVTNVVTAKPGDYLVHPIDDVMAVDVVGAKDFEKEYELV